MGPDLFSAVVVLRADRERRRKRCFFRGCMQSRLREHLVAPRLGADDQRGVRRPALRHLSLVHIVLAFALGLYLGLHRRGHRQRAAGDRPATSLNNVLYTLQTALGMTLQGRRAHLIAVPDRGRGVRGLRAVGASGGSLRAAAVPPA